MSDSVERKIAKRIIKSLNIIILSDNATKKVISIEI